MNARCQIARLTHEEWVSRRAGFLTASTFGELMRGAGDRARIARVAERITSRVYDDGGARDSRGWGKGYEAEARRMLALVGGFDMTDPPLWAEHPDVPLVGCSPDGWIYNERCGVEVKCPTNEDVRRRSRYGGPRAAFELRPDWEWQVQGSMWVTGTARWLFVIYDPTATLNGRVVGSLGYWMIDRNDAKIARLERRVRAAAEQIAKIRDSRHADA